MKMRYALLSAVILFAACKKDDIPADNAPAPMGKVSGRVVAANNTTPVRNATVFIAKGADIYHTYTDVNGNFLLEAPAGQHELHIQSGSGSIFRTKMTVQVVAEQTTPVATNAVKLTQVASLAYVPGTYDKIESIIMDSLGYNASGINTNTLHVLSQLTQYNAIFINCSSSVPVDWVQDSVLATYVANGGSIYTSDYAVAALIGTHGGSCPNPRQGGFIPDSKLCTQRIGNTGMIYNAQIISPVLQTYLNKFFMNITYNLGAWETVMNYDANYWEVMVRHPATQAPLLLRTNAFTNASAGTVNIGSSTNSNMVIICHKPQGTTPVTITVPAADLAMHLAHGDTQGSCNSANGAGRIYYTTFHNEPNGQISPDMKNILEYMILNL